MNAIYILTLRQLKRYIRSKPRIIGSLGQPLLFLLALGFGFGPIFARAGGGNYIQFVSPEIMSMGILFTAVFSGLEIIWDRQFGFLKETLVAPVSRLQIVMGRTVGGAIVALIQGLIVFVLCLIAGFRIQSVALVIVALVFMFLISLFFTGVGTAIASVMNDMQGFPLVMNFLVMPLFFLSTALFPVTGLPKALQIVIRVNPLTFGVDGLRGVLTGVHTFGIVADFALLSILTFAILSLGAYLFSKIQL